MDKKIETQILPLSKLHLNTGQIPNVPKNPRFIKDERFKALKKSIEDDPEMLNLREIVAYDNSEEFVVILGNMRYRAMKELGIKEAPVKVLPAYTPAEKLRAYIQKDNIAFGQNDWDLLGNEWDIEELKDFGLECEFLDTDLMQDPLDGVEELSEETYDKPEKDMLQCPHCHHIDSKTHFKKIASDAKDISDNEMREQNEDIP